MFMRGEDVYVTDINLNKLSNKALGDWGETVAVDFLQVNNFQILARNWRSRLGELDIVAIYGIELHVVEVKTRRSIQAGLPIEAVDYRKYNQLRKLTYFWLKENSKTYIQHISLDVIGILVNKNHYNLQFVRGITA